MADVKSINIDTKPTGILRVTLRHGIIWGYLIAAETAAHLLFGGSWVIDIMVVSALILILSHQAMKQSGFVVNMTPSEIRLWVAAGMPDNIKEWRATRKLHEVA